MKGCFAEADTGERMFCYSRHVKGHVMKDSLLTTHMYWSALHCIVELHLSGLSVSRCFHTLGLIGRVMSAETEARAEARHVGDT